MNIKVKRTAFIINRTFFKKKKLCVKFINVFFDQFKVPLLNKHFVFIYNSVYIYIYIYILYPKLLSGSVS